MKKIIDSFRSANYLKSKFSSGFTSEQRSNLVYSALLAITVGLFVINFAQDVFTENISIWGIDLLMILVVASLQLMLRKFPLVSKFLGFLFINLALFYFTVITGNKTQVDSIFFSVVACTFLVFGSKNFWIGFAFSVFSFLLIICYQLYFSPELTLGRDYDLSGTLINLFSAYCILILIIVVLIKINTLYEENLLEEKKKLQQANEELDRFIYSMSHDLRAPLSSIKGLVQLAQKETETIQLAQYFPMIENRIDNLGRFIEDVTNYARNIRIEIKAEQLNLRDSINEVWVGLKFTEGASNIKLITDFEEAATITIDKIRLRIVLNNLLSNAIKYQDFGKPSNERFIKISYRSSNNSFSLVFEDNGIGIPADQLPLLFTMFHRASAQAQGSGLGLFIVKQTIEKLGGTIRVNSIQGRGTTFSIELKSV